MRPGDKFFVLGEPVTMDSDGDGVLQVGNLSIEASPRDSFWGRQKSGATAQVRFSTHGTVWDEHFQQDVAARCALRKLRVELLQCLADTDKLLAYEDIDTGDPE
jgi:hypothetical protein